MELALITSMLTKGLCSATLVLIMAAVAERVSPRLAGILSGLPLSAVIVYFFIGLDMGVDFAVASVPHGVAAFVATLAYVLTYYVASRRLKRHAAIGSTLLGIIVFFTVAFPISMIPFTLLTATATTVFVLIFMVWLFRRIVFITVEEPVRYTARLLFARGGIAALLIVIVITTAEALPPKWTGILAGFPTTLLPTFLILHLTYGPEQTHAMMRSFPIGMVSILLFILSVSVTFPQWGVYGGTAASLAVSLAYITIVVLLGFASTQKSQ